MSDSLKTAYRFHRAKSRPLPATEALIHARVDVANGKARYPHDGKPTPAVCWQSPEDRKPRSSEKLGYVQSIDGAGLRLVGRVTADCNRRNGIWDSRGDSGWYTDPYGDTFRDGTGLCYGVVYQLTGRDGKARFVAGYIFGGCSEDLPTVDFGTIFEESRGDWSYNLKDCDAAHSAAHVADSMARIAAEEEREYQTAWQAGSRYSQCLDELRQNRSAVLATIRAMKGACATLRGLPDVLRDRLRASIESDLEARTGLFAKLEKLASGEAEYLEFYPSTRLRAAFNEGAGKDVLTA